jgi:hypothetical protein
VAQVAVGQALGRVRKLARTFVWWAYACRLLRAPKIVIEAPGYTHLSSGVRCLHLLCDSLNRLGVRAAVTADVVDSRLNTPRPYMGTISDHPAILDRSIVIYPEVVAGNPLRAKNVVRYLLNIPGYFNDAGLETYGAEDYFLHFADEFCPPGLKSRRLRLPLVDTAVFTPPPHAKRNGFLVYSARYQPDVAAFPDWIDNITMISSAAPRDPPAIAALYRSSRAFIVGERTAAIAEALHCHCPVIILPHAGFDYEPVVAFAGGLGLTVGFGKEGLARATETAPAFRAHYAAQFVDVDAAILEFVSDAARYFGLQNFR